VRQILDSGWFEGEGSRGRGANLDGECKKSWGNDLSIWPWRSRKMGMLQMANNGRWIVRLEAIDADGTTRGVSEPVTITRDLHRAESSDFGLKLSEGKAVLERLQAWFTQFQIDQIAKQDRSCADCETPRRMHDYQSRQIQTLFGKVTVRVPRYHACRCRNDQQQDHAKGEVTDLIPGRTTQEFDHVVAELGARHSFREAVRIMNMFVPTSSKHNHMRVQSRLAKVADWIEARDGQAPYRMSRSTDGPVSVFIDGTYVRAAPGHQTRHFEVVMGRVETNGRPPVHFAAMPNVTLARHEIVRSTMKMQGWLPGRKVIVFSDGDPSLAEYHCAEGRL